MGPFFLIGITDENDVGHPSRNVVESIKQTAAALANILSQYNNHIDAIEISVNRHLAWL